MPRDHRRAKEMRNPTEEYDRLHDHCQALGRQRDFLLREVERLTDELQLAHEALRRDMP
jgi:predicted DNA-binding protein